MAAFRRPSRRAARCSARSQRPVEAANGGRRPSRERPRAAPRPPADRASSRSTRRSLYRVSIFGPCRRCSRRTPRGVAQTGAGRASASSRSLKNAGGALVLGGEDLSVGQPSAGEPRCLPEDPGAGGAPRRDVQICLVAGVARREAVGGAGCPRLAAQLESATSKCSGQSCTREGSCEADPARSSSSADAAKPYQWPRNAAPLPSSCSGARSSSRPAGSSSSRGAPPPRERGDLGATQLPVLIDDQLGALHPDLDVGAEERRPEAASGVAQTDLAVGVASRRRDHLLGEPVEREAGRDELWRNPPQPAVRPEPTFGAPAAESIVPLGNFSQRRSPVPTGDTSGTPAFWAPRATGSSANQWTVRDRGAARAQ